ncbi:hypothetical protein DFJ74DRAFT_668740 [Hyaloraphidium curvatum]|nr:hypothetical protein DFJ74DRAFT_668740 [Hyaloraphidium curvatum]
MSVALTRRGNFGRGPTTKPTTSNNRMATRDAGPGASPEAQLEFIRAYLRDRGLDSRIDVVLASQAGPPLSKSGDAESAPENDASTDDADGGDDWVDDDDEGPSKAPEGAGRVMVAARDFEPGDVIFHEPPLLHTSPRPPFKNNPYRSVPLPHDWQRLLLHYTHILGGPSEAKEFALGALAALSTDGVTSTLAQETDPDRLPYWRSGAKQWTERYRKNAKKAKSKPPPVSIDAIEHLIHVIETNCHSADKADGTQDDLGSDLGDAVEIEEEVGVYFAGSFCNHSCLPNATVILNPPDADAAAPDASSTAAGPHPTWLTLRCIAPIAKGESITISYTDESMLPAAHRQSRLTIRGFTCHCELCSSDDVMRAAQCTCTKDGQAFALPPKWLCAKCGKKLDAKAVAKLAKLEDGYLDLEDEVGASQIDAAGATHIDAAETRCSVS